MRFERADGYDTVQWAANLAGSNGRVGMYSASYCGNAQLLAAGARPAGLAAISPAMTWSEPMDGLCARGGAVELGVAVRWALENGFDVISRLSSSDSELERRAAAIIDDWDRLGQQGYWDLPASDLAVLRRHGIPDLGGIRVLNQPQIADRARVTGSYDRIEVPSLHTAGWYDIFVQGTLDNYEALATAGRDTRLIVGPWTHHAFADPIGERTFGMRAGRDHVPGLPDPTWCDFQLAWFATHLGEDPGIQLTEAPVRIFVMGRNEWRDLSSWPPQHVKIERWFLHSDRSVSTRGPESADRESAFEYDPANPAPTLGGNGVMSPGYPAGPVDQATLEARHDVLVFTSDPLEHDLEVTGRVRVVLHAQSSAPSTDWVARLCDVHPDGRSFNVCDGILRIAERAHEDACHEIDLWSTSNVFLRGHRLRVHITSSSFPRWDRNLNTGNQRDPRHEVAHQHVHHAAERPSYIELPIAPQVW
jgi:hypothetical protein